jgi:hypothetical protein
MNQQLPNISLKDAIQKSGRMGSKGIQRAQTIGRIITNKKVYAELASQETDTCIFIFLARCLISISLSSDFNYIFFLKKKYDMNFKHKIFVYVSDLHKIIDNNFNEF